MRYPHGLLLVAVTACAPGGPAPEAISLLGEGLVSPELTGELLGGRIAALASDDERRASLAAASRRLARPDAAAVIVDRMERLLGLEDRTAATPERNVRSG